MLRNIGFITLLAVMFVVLFTGNVQAQASSDNISASATVVANVSIAKTTDLSFGTLGQTTSGAVVLDATTAAVNHYVGTDAQVGEFTLSGANNSRLIFTFANTDLVGQTDGTKKITFTPSVVGGATHAGAAAVTSGTAYNVNGAYYLWVGGSLPKLTNQAAQVYTAPFQIAVDYN